MDHSIIVRPNHGYGRKLWVPVCETTLKFATLLKQTSFSESDIQAIKALGYTITTVSEEL